MKLKHLILAALTGLAVITACKDEPLPTPSNNGQPYVIDKILNKALLPESWASCIEYIITNDIFNNIPTYQYDKEKHRDYQFQPTAKCKEKGYTPLFIDCIDNYNQREYSEQMPIDRVSGYTLSQIENDIGVSYKQFFSIVPIDPIGIADPVGLSYNSHSLKFIKENLKTMYNNPTSEYLDELFDNYLK